MKHFLVDTLQLRSRKTGPHVILAEFITKPQPLKSISLCKFLEAGHKNHEVILPRLLAWKEKSDSSFAISVATRIIESIPTEPVDVDFVRWMLENAPFTEQVFRGSREERACGFEHCFLGYGCTFRAEDDLQVAQLLRDYRQFIALNEREAEDMKRFQHTHHLCVALRHNLVHTIRFLVSEFHAFKEKLKSQDFIHQVISDITESLREDDKEKPNEEHTAANVIDYFVREHDFDPDETTLPDIAWKDLIAEARESTLLYLITEKGKDIRQKRGVMPRLCNITNLTVHMQLFPYVHVGIVAKHAVTSVELQRHLMSMFDKKETFALHNMKWVMSVIATIAASEHENWFGIFFLLVGKLFDHCVSSHHQLWVQIAFRSNPSMSLARRAEVLHVCSVVFPIFNRSSLQTYEWCPDICINFHKGTSWKIIADLFLKATAFTHEFLDYAWETYEIEPMLRSSCTSKQMAIILDREHYEFDLGGVPVRVAFHDMALTRKLYEHPRTLKGIDYTQWESVDGKLGVGIESGMIEHFLYAEHDDHTEQSLGSLDYILSQPEYNMAAIELAQEDKVWRNFLDYAYVGGIYRPITTLDILERRMSGIVTKILHYMAQSVAWHPSCLADFQRVESAMKTRQLPLDKWVRCCFKTACEDGADIHMMRYMMENYPESCDLDSVPVLADNLEELRQS